VSTGGPDARILPAAAPLTGWRARVHRWLPGLLDGRGHWHGADGGPLRGREVRRWQAARQASSEVPAPETADTSPSAAPVAPAKRRRQAAKPPAPPTAPVQAAAGLHCPECHEPVGAAEHVCSGCGFVLHPDAVCPTCYHTLEADRGCWFCAMNARHAQRRLAAERGAARHHLPLGRHAPHTQTDHIRNRPKKPVPVRKHLRNGLPVAAHTRLKPGQAPQESVHAG
jgi:hypothetical protein